ncbi:helix-turn-helix domain-containing protein [Hymenobacter sp.]|uniref:AraC family transcriptional regulator n=1 Tax=Hymenobacter sp. TaxID=1898978 RepID=UPI00286A2447|nr:helix-turn-helix domain-containing protein [Hymenobacter sp.]
MKIERHLPPAFLRPYVRALLLIESDAEAQNLVLPDTSLVLAVQYRGRVLCTQNGVARAAPAAALTGLSNAPRQLTYAPGTSTLLVQFKEMGAAFFFPLPLHELFGHSLPLDQLLPPAQVRELGERVAAAPSTQLRLAVVAHFLLARLRPSPPDVPIRQAVQAIRASGGTLPIHAVAAGLALSRDPFEKHFRRLVGTSPKQFAAIVRLRGVLAHRPVARSLTELAHAAGYFDQAHFNKDFKAFTGQAPTAFFAGGAYW